MNKTTQLALELLALEAARTKDKGELVNNFIDDLNVLLGKKPSRNSYSVLSNVVYGRGLFEKSSVTYNESF